MLKNKLHKVANRSGASKTNGPRKAAARKRSSVRFLSLVIQRDHRWAFQTTTSRAFWRKRTRNQPFDSFG